VVDLEEQVQALQQVEEVEAAASRPTVNVAAMVVRGDQ
jgi:hypothetical protein